jgi:hypothetical protein
MGKKGTKLREDSFGLVKNIGGIYAAIDAKSDSFKEWRHPEGDKVVKFRTFIGEQSAMGWRPSRQRSRRRRMIRNKISMKLYTIESTLASFLDLSAFSPSGFDRFRMTNRMGLLLIITHIFVRVQCRSRRCM